jgi:hypothetical protein
LPVVAKKSVALAVFNAIADGLETKSKRSKYIVELRDEGDRWTIFESLRGADSTTSWFDRNGKAMETVRVTMGGGGLQMTISKCTGTISDAAFAK